MTPQPIIDPIDPALIERELTPERFLRRSNKGGNLLYTIDGRECPATMQEIGRLREQSFRAAGGGTGKSVDIDEFDTMDPPCRQLIVWDPVSRLILGGYRYIIGKDIRLNPDGSPRIAMSHMFSFSPDFISRYLPETIELGRSFVRVQYQSSQVGTKALFALDNLWDGLGALTVIHPSIKHLLGKMTMYPSYDRRCRNLILYFLQKHFPDSDSMVRPINALDTSMDLREMERVFEGNTFKDDYRTLNHLVREQGFNIPPLVNSYMSLSPTMRVFGTAINDEFGDVEETGIFLTIAEIFEEKKQRHIGTYVPSQQLADTSL